LLDDGTGACPPLCDPSSGAGCPSPLACYVILAQDSSGTTIGLTSVCAGAGDEPPGAPCMGDVEACEPGHACVEVDGESLCRAVCRMGAGECGASSCRSFVPPATIGGEEFGFCP
jgi:hypothetical protein